MKTWNAKNNEITPAWWIVDAEGKTLGRMATEIATVLRGKHKPTFTPHVDTGDFVVVVNSSKVKMTGNKWDNKKYYSRSRFFGSLKEQTAKELLEKDSDQIVINAVRGMIPRNKLGRKLMNKLKVYETAVHPHAAQQPAALEIKG